MRHLNRLRHLITMALAAPLVDRADAAELNEARAMGERDEARREAVAARADTLDSERDAAIDAARVVTLEHEIETLRSEAASAATADEAHTLTAEALESVTVERDELQAENARIRNERDRSFAEVDSVRSILEKVVSDRDVACSAAVELQSEVDKARQERDSATRALAEATRRAARAEESIAACPHLHGHNVAPEPVAAEPWPRPDVDVADACAWCGAEGTGWFNDHVMVCTTHGKVGIPTWEDINARIETRAASCPARRDSADPLAKACTGCGADKGQPCDLAKRRESDEAQCARDLFFGTGRSGRAG